MKEIHLICNAHIDPVWQWNWQEAVGVTLATFATAADLCEEYPAFVFNHNEALLYEWVEQHDPILFERIRRLVREKRWHIMGGWYIQPDCNLPSGESLIRQITTGRMYFREKFGVEPQVAASMDAFGHSRGLVQILQQSDYTGYILMRANEDAPKAFVWKGYAGSQITAVRLLTCYNSPMGNSAACIKDYINEHAEDEVQFRFWGVGNHGGGPSKKDLKDLIALQQETSTKIIHSTPENYFDTLKSEQLPVKDDQIGPVFVGCYSSMQRIKKLNRRLESQIYTAEALSVLAYQQKGIAYPREKLDIAQKALLFSQFHDILPGTCIESAEEASIQRLHSGLQIADECIFNGLISLCRDELPALPGDTPLFVFQPQPDDSPCYFEYEFMLADQNWSDDWFGVTAWCDGVEVPVQILKEESNLNLDWRKRIGILAPLRPLGVTRFDLKLYKKKGKLRDSSNVTENLLTIHTAWGKFVLRKSDGIIVSLVYEGREYAKEGLGTLWSFRDHPDPWSMEHIVLGTEPERFSLLSAEEMEEFTGWSANQVSSVQIIEQGPVLTRIQLLFGHKSTRVSMQYTVFNEQPWVDMDIRIYNAEPNHIYRLSLPVEGGQHWFRAQDICGVKDLSDEAYEQVIHQWVRIGNDHQTQLSVINDSSYSVCVRDGELMATLLRTPVYVAHPLPGRPLLEEKRFLSHMDQGIRSMRFRLIPGNLSEQDTDLKAQNFNTPPVATTLFPRGNGTERPSMTVQGAQLMALKLAIDGDGYILRVFRNLPEAGEVIIDWPTVGVHTCLRLEGYQIQTLRITGGRVILCNILEKNQLEKEC